MLGRQQLLLLLATALLSTTVSNAFVTTRRPISSWRGGPTSKQSSLSTAVVSPPPLYNNRRTGTTTAMSSADGGAKGSKKQIFSVVVSGLCLFFLANVAESYLNDKYNFWPELKTEWNYSGSNDEICRQMAAKGESSELCSDSNRAAAQAKLAQKQAYIKGGGAGK